MRTIRHLSTQFNYGSANLNFGEYLFWMRSDQDAEETFKKSMPWFSLIDVGVLTGTATNILHDKLAIAAIAHAGQQSGVAVTFEAVFGVI